MGKKKGGGEPRYIISINAVIAAMATMVCPPFGEISFWGLLRRQTYFGDQLAIDWGLPRTLELVLLVGDRSKRKKNKVAVLLRDKPMSGFVSMMPSSI